eukprot:CAMPEP_0119482710 /NCGR_PEP_ID=MMETSP1344-20130328/10446_1 /TAXON_ID=236787 /ORGANISM="Florenciella parvula, Strain CCMP2471" /LENGTH=55 /DNA_ID=CAMNT_0007517143 /DNA_START=201 /DNA_END=365 /DNA_ORIENTATION=-
MGVAPPEPPHDHSKAGALPPPGASENRSEADSAHRETAARRGPRSTVSRRAQAGA